MWWYCLVVSCVAASFMEYQYEKKLVHIAQGPVRGREEADGVFAFYNIPYATAPSGENKFKAPLPPPKWTTTFEAIDRGVICPQTYYGKDLFTKRKTMYEDCLIANIYVPSTNETNHSVVVYIHGGGFQVGFGDRRKAKQLMKSKKIVVVNFNYRLGVHGFLCLGTNDIPGNAGMKDMIAMLRWVKTNIASFGGNPNDVTISGYSTGAAAADLLILSKPARGLFRKVIIESGASISAIQSNPLENAKSYPNKLNFTKEDNIVALEKFYKTVPYEILFADSFLATKNSNFVFTPCIERNLSEEVFLHDYPINILRKGKYAQVPMLYGFTNMEGLMRISFFDNWKLSMNEKFEDFLPTDLIFSNDEEKEEIAQSIKEFYFGTKPIDANNLSGFINYFTDIMIAVPALRSVSLNVASGNKQIYLYYYSFIDEDDAYTPYIKIRGANHCAQSHAIFDDLTPKNTSVKFRILRKVMRRMWHNFIRTGQPVPRKSTVRLDWPRATASRGPYMSFGQGVELNNNLLEERATFWDVIYQKYYREPIAPRAIKKKRYYW